jgi:uncharacterized protein
VLGILVMNIQDYSMINAAYSNPTAYGDLTGPNWRVWLLSHIFADQKFMTLFSMLFGAGIVLFTTRAQSKGVQQAGVHYRRTLWLLLFGILHGYGLWRGDILYAYAVCALLVYLFRGLPPKRLLSLGFVSLAICSVLYLLIGMSIPSWPTEDVVAMTEDFWMPTNDQIAEEVAAYSGSYSEQMTHRIPTTMGMQTGAFFFYFLWRAGGLMLIGMALYKLGVLAAEFTTRFYLALMVVGFGIGIPLITYGVDRHIHYGWSFEYSFFLGSQFNYWGSLFVATAYLGSVMLAVRCIKSRRLWEPLAATGRMAFTNYIMQTVLCTFIFYGHGLGLFGTVERTGQILLVMGIWILQILVSWLWLRYFRFGPLEWLWRSLTYWRVQPMGRA